MNEELNTTPCVRSGFCCKTAVCGFGKRGPDGQCIFLISEIKGEGYEFYRCGNYDYIVQQPGHEFMPAFGAGCCSNLNSLRHANIQALLDKKVDPRAIIAEHWFNK